MMIQERERMSARVALTTRNGKRAGLSVFLRNERHMPPPASASFESVNHKPLIKDVSPQLSGMSQAYNGSGVL